MALEYRDFLPLIKGEVETIVREGVFKKRKRYRSLGLATNLVLCQFDLNTEIHIIRERKLLEASHSQMKKKSKTKPKKTLKPKAVGSQKGIFPLNDRILVRPFEAEELTKTASGIIIPETVSKEKPEQGEVIAVGLGKWEDGKRVPLGVKVGERVLFSKYGYDEVKYEGKEYYILREESILAIIIN